MERKTNENGMTNAILSVEYQGLHSGTPKEW